MIAPDIGVQLDSGRADRAGNGIYRARCSRANTSPLSKAKSESLRSMLDCPDHKYVVKTARFRSAKTQMIQVLRETDDTPESVAHSLEIAAALIGFRESNYRAVWDGMG